MSNPNKMLIDATHPEETRVVVLRNGRVEEFDYESAARKLLRGNIYLAKVTRVEPSLQAAFVDYGGNRHGFLAFNEIHPDYYQIPVADRQALLDEEAEQEAREEAEADARAERLERRQRQSQSPRRRGDGEGLRASTADDATSVEGDGAPGEHDEASGFDSAAHDDNGSSSAMPLEAYQSDDSLTEEVSFDSDESSDEGDEPEVVGGFEGDADTADHGADDSEDDDDAARDDRSAHAADHDHSSDDHSDEAPRSEPIGEDNVELAPPPAAAPQALEQTGSEDALEELPSRQRRRPRSYKIQEVIKRRQIILIQVVKEERGNKGAALTTYLSLAGRYTVLMPNTARGGGISRKITQPQDRKRLKAIANELEVPDGMGLIIRTAGAARTKQEIKRDFEYLLRLWESVRDLTLESTAPSLVYEEGNLIKRSIRDLYNKDVEEIIVAGDHAHKDAIDFMRMLMPSHAKNVLAHADPEPLFTKYGIERQLNAMFSPYVTLRSGGYLVINQTEALVAVDVNSGKSTREFSIEETALNTNLEAADEVARQVKLRDLAGLIVIDFIDMEEKRNNRAVERRVKEALRFDRARIQLGHISHFGLMEMSRQRMRTGVLEGSTTQCPHCQGTGIIRSTESVALAVLRGLEDALMTGGRASLVATTTAQVALYILNSKRAFINDMETRNGVSVSVQASDKLQGANFTIERGASVAQPMRRPERAAVNMDWGFEGDDAEAPASAVSDDSYDDDVSSESSGESSIRMVPRTDEESDTNGSQSDGRKRRRRGGRRGGPDRERGDGERNGSRGGGRDGQGERQARPDRSQGRNNNGNPAVQRPGLDDDGPRAIGITSGFDAGDESADAGSVTSSEEGTGTTSSSRTEDGRGEDRGRRRRRGRRGGRRGRGERGDRPGHEGAHDESKGDHEGGSTAAAEGSESGFEIKVAETKITDFDSAVIDERGAGEARPARSREPRQERRPDRPSEHVSAAPDRATENKAAGHERMEQTPVAAKARERSMAASGEPVIESVVMRPDGAQESAEPASPKRGWWQRTLGG